MQVLRVRGPKLSTYVLILRRRHENVEEVLISCIRLCMAQANLSPTLATWRFLPHAHPSRGWPFICLLGMDSIRAFNPDLINHLYYISIFLFKINN